MEKDAGSCCSICLAEYTSSGSHRVVSLKCGHLFGSECIEKWLSLYKKNYCPTCSSPFKKAQIRPIFAVKIVAHESENEKEFIEKYIKENEARKSLEREVSNLKSQIEIIKSSNKANSIVKQNSHKIHMNFFKYCKIHFFTGDNQLVFDPINQSLLISCLKNAQFGIFKYSISDFSLNSFIGFSEQITSIKISPFGDGLCLVAFGNTVSLINIYSEVAVRSFLFDIKITAISFCKENREILLAGDIKGNLHWIYLNSNKVEQTSVCNENIHSIVENGSTVFISTVFNVYSHRYQNESRLFNKEEIQTQGICTSLTVDLEGNFLAIYRSFGFAVNSFVLGTRNYNFDPEVKQFLRHDDCFLNGYLFIVDDSKDRIKVFDKNTLQMVYSYSFKEKVVRFCGDSNIFIVLTRKGIYLYDSKG